MNYSQETGLPDLNLVSILVTDRKRRGVAYLSLGEGRRLDPIGTCFFVDYGDHQLSRYAVTARHCIEDVSRQSIFIELTDYDGKYRRFRTQPTDWIKAENTDLACFPIGLASTEIAIEPQKQWASNQRLREGTEVAIIGLFARSPYRTDETGQLMVEPIARFGRVALRHTKVGVAFSKNKPKALTVIDVILIESMAYEGHSGSPVLLHENYTRDARHRARGFGVRKVDITDADVDTPLLGMISSGFPWEQGTGTKRKLINTGISAVVPTGDIIGFIMNNPELKKSRDSVDKPRVGETTPFSVDPKAESDFTKEDFENALKRASRRIQPLPPDEGKSKT